MDQAALPKMREHVCSFFDGHASSEDRWIEGPMAEIAPWFSVLVFAPGPRTPLWTYVSLGASTLPNPTDSALEFVISTEKPTRRAVELLTIVSYYHRDYGLGVGHTAGLGEPWLPGSTCEHILVSLPYPFGPDLEICNLENQHIHFLWFLPITEAERELAVEHGLEALEQRFDAAGIRYWLPRRASAV